MYRQELTVLPSGSMMTRAPITRRYLLGSGFLATGAALLVYVVSGVSLPAALALALTVAAAFSAAVWRGLAAPGRAEALRAIRAGIAAGAAATAAYDLSRWLIVEVAGFTFWPFDIFTLFGQALLGAEHTGPWVTLAGVAFHVVNGVGFGIAYTLWIGRRGVLAGVAWAMALETLMVTVYPGWLGLKALDEFLQVSILGHAAYGSVLGFTARRLLARADAVGCLHG